MKKVTSFFALMLLLALAAPGSLLGQETRDPAGLGFIKGFSWGWIGSRGEYASPVAADSMQKLADTGNQWVCIAFAGRMATYDTPSIQFADAEPRMITDDELRHAIRLARENGMKVMLKPMVICDDGTWRAWIKFFRPVMDQERAARITGEMDPWQDIPKMREGMVKDDQKWDLWWKSFSTFLLHYAAIAQEEHVPLVCLGCEMNSTEECEDRWRELIKRIRGIYGGQLTYDVNDGRENELTWWDAVDLVSISAYYQVPPPAGRSIEEAAKQTTPLSQVVEALEPIKARLARLSARTHKPILFIETGVTNVRGCARYPWAHPDEHEGSPLDQQEQVNYYEGMFQVFWNEPWFMGFCWWDWPAQLYDRADATDQRSFCVYGKAAEETLRDWYAKPRAAAVVK
jgi:hypothetical protein